MSKAKYIIDSIDHSRSSTMGRAKDILSRFDEAAKVLGYTQSGKSVFSEFDPSKYSSFSKQDHLDAAQILGKESWKLSQFHQKDKDALASEYSKVAMLHTNAYQKVKA
jgi:hypothetical protein